MIDNDFIKLNTCVNCWDCHQGALMVDEEYVIVL